MEKIERVRVVQCLTSEKIGANDACLVCRDSKRCLTLRPKLADEVKKFPKRFGVPSAEDIASFKKNYPEAFELDNRVSSSKMSIGHGVRIARCVPVEPLKDEEVCKTCRLKGCCIIINPELAEFVDKRKTDDGMYKFSRKDIAFLEKKYPDTVRADDDESDICTEAMAEYLINYYQRSELLRTIVPKEIFSRLMADRYSFEEIEFLYLGINQKWEKMERVFEEILPPQPKF